MDDTAAITALTERFCVILDTHDVEAHREVWADDGRLDVESIGRGTHRGIAAILAFYEEVRAAADVRVHRVEGHHVALDGDEAAGGCRFRADGVRGSGEPVHLTGHYEDRYRRVGGRWFFAERRVVVA
jgi:hypothetical protein